MSSLKKLSDIINIPSIKSALAPATGTGRYWKHSAKTIRMVKKGCANRPFYQIVVMERRKNQFEPVVEQVGTYDPMPNAFNQKMVSFNYERIRLWIGRGAFVSTPVAELLGLAGFFPIHPRTYMEAWRTRAKERENAETSEAEAKKAENSN